MLLLLILEPSGYHGQNLSTSSCCPMFSQASQASELTLRGPANVKFLLSSGTDLSLELPFCDKLRSGGSTPPSTTAFSSIAHIPVFSKYVQSLKQSVEPRPDPTKVAVKKKKEEEKAREKELNDLFKVVVTQPKVPVGVDPKSILCEFFKAGQCQKGFKCKFLHDLNIQRKGGKIDIYNDKHDGETMEDWDQETLEKVVE
ncbi:hypothetical protein WN944_023803 [Citrus x changshan-huyou]|uniref:C3H1-type domain-containing protein n=1 Tax=Citrus x changshan-huyou TaxID=2935761 RepID=A0AAP0LLT2_9ROSI